MTRRGGRSRRGRRGGRDEQLPETPISDLRWMILDHFAHFSKSGGDEAVADGTRSEVSDTSTGKSIAVSLRVAVPPAVSRLYIHFPQGLWPELKELRPPPSVVAAHGRSILFQTRVPDTDQCRPSDCPVDYFVYTASGRSGKRPSLRRLPPCFEFGPVGPVVNGIQKQRMMTRDHMGLLCHGDEGFTVAELSFCGELCLLYHAPEKADFEWDVRTLQMPYGKGVPEDLLCGSWNTDVVVPFGDSLCWVDCYLGLLFVSVHGDLTTAKQPRHVPMPADLDPRRLYIDGGSPDPARRVCVTDGGMIKLICVSDLAGRSMHIYSSNFKIRTWNLINGIWEEDAAMEGHEFEDILASDKRLPRLLPEYPTMSLVDHDVVCFVLNNTSRISWLVEVNLKKKVLGAVTLYINEENEDQAAAQGGEEETLEEFLLKLFYNTIFSNPFAFIPSKLTMYLDKHAIKSLGYSKKLQKAEVKRAIKNGWIKHGKHGLA